MPGTREAKLAAHGFSTQTNTSPSPGSSSYPEPKKFGILTADGIPVQHFPVTDM